VAAARQERIAELDATWSRSVANLTQTNLNTAAARRRSEYVDIYAVAGRSVPTIYAR
jgi:hypothetical protein